MIHRDTGVAPDEVYTAAEEFGEIFLLRFLLALMVVTREFHISTCLALVCKWW